MITENILMFFVTLATFILGIAIWKKFKPKDWNLTEFTYKDESAHDVPDLPIDAPTLFGSNVSPPIVGKEGVEIGMTQQMRDSAGIENYRRFIDKRRRKDDEKNQRRK